MENKIKKVGDTSSLQLVTVTVKDGPGEDVRTYELNYITTSPYGRLVLGKHDKEACHINIFTNLFVKHAHDELLNLTKKINDFFPGIIESLRLDRGYDQCGTLSLAHNGAVSVTITDIKENKDKYSVPVNIEGVFVRGEIWIRTHRYGEIHYRAESKWTEFNASAMWLNSEKVIKIWDHSNFDTTYKWSEQDYRGLLKKVSEKVKPETELVLATNFNSDQKRCEIYFKHEEIVE